MKSVTNKEYRVVSLNNNVLKINTQDSDSYRALATKLNEEGKEWFTYEDKNNRNIKVMARGLHPTCQKEDVIEDLKIKELQVEDARLRKCIVHFVHFMVSLGDLVRRLFGMLLRNFASNLHYWT